MVGAEVAVLNSRGTAEVQGLQYGGVQGGSYEGVNLKRAGSRWTSAEYELTWEINNIRIPQNTRVMSYAA